MAERRTSMLLLVGAAVIAIVALVWWRRDAQRPAHRGADARPARGAPHAPVSPGGREEPAAPEPAPDPAIPTAIDDGPPEPPPPTKETGPVAPQAMRPLAEVKDVIAGLIRDAVRPCLHPGEIAAGSDQMLTVRYNLVIRRGLVHAQDLVVIDSSVADEGLAECILGTMGDQEWAVSGAASTMVQVQDSIRLADLRAPG